MVVGSSRVLSLLRPCNIPMSGFYLSLWLVCHFSTVAISINPITVFLMLVFTCCVCIFICFIKFTAIIIIRFFCDFISLKQLLNLFITHRSSRPASPLIMSSHREHKRSNRPSLPVEIINWEQAIFSHCISYIFLFTPLYLSNDKVYKDLCESLYSSSTDSRF